MVLPIMLSGQVFLPLLKNGFRVKKAFILQTLFIQQRLGPSAVVGLLTMHRLVPQTPVLAARACSQARIDKALAAKAISLFQRVFSFLLGAARQTPPPGGHPKKERVTSRLLPMLARSTLTRISPGR